MPKALAWSLNMILGAPSASAASRPPLWLLWLSVGYGVLALFLFGFCLVVHLLFFRSPLVGGLGVGLSYLILTWHRLPVSRGGAYVLSGFLSPVESGGEYDVFRRLGCYMGLLLLRIVLVFCLSVGYGPLWVFPVLLLSGSCQGGCLVHRPVRVGSALSGSGRHVQWVCCLALLLCFSLLGFFSSHGLRFFWSCVVCGLIFPWSCGQCNRGFLSRLGPAVFRRVCWTLSEFLALFVFGVVLAL